ncbi:MAG: hypothetical protein HYV03_02070, partial [Deltaproteobacteria bacterium]|nr:hypothetical protein [Deltaproteobacteria bacterium]
YSEVESFGSKRAGPVTKAREAVQALPVGGYLTKEEVMEIMAYYLDRAGVDVENPAFNTGGRSLFPFIYHHTAAHKEAPEPTRPFDKSELKR